MGIKTLEEHKADRLAEEEALALKSTQDDEVEAEEEAPEETETETEVSADTEDEVETEAEPEDWMQSEADDSQSNDKIPDAAWGAARKSYKEKASRSEEKHKAEVDELKRKVEELSKAPAPQAIAPTGRPKREDFYDRENPDDSYDDAMYEWRGAQDRASNQRRDQDRSIEERKSKLSLAVDDHYSRAEKLAASGITAEAYSGADEIVRNQIGTPIVDELISAIGEGSEKVLYSLGRNPTKLAELQGLLASDPSGSKAMFYLGKMASTFSATKRKSLAPAPATNVSGDKQKSRSEGAQKKAYAAAHKSNNSQKAWNIKKEAKAAGVNTNDW